MAKYRFKLLSSITSEGGKTYAADGHPFSDHPDCAGNVIETDKDLSVHNSPGNIRYARLNKDDDESVIVGDEDITVTDDSDEVDLSKMTKAKLIQFAEENDLGVDTSLRKDELIDAIVSVMNGDDE